MNGWTPARFEQLAELRGWTEAAIVRLGLGYDERSGRVVFPVRDETGEPGGTLRYQPDPARRSESQPKMLADAGTTRELFPPPETVGDDELGEERFLFLTEGEPDMVRLWSLGLPTVAVPGAQNWKPEWAARVAGRRWTVVVCFDCDEAGRTNAARVAGDLAAAGVDVRLFDLDPGRDDGFDLTHFLVGDNLAARERLLGRARSATPPNPAAELAALLDDVEVFVRAFVVVTAAQAAAITLWVAHTHAVDASEATPYLAVTSATMRSGKSRLLEVVRGLVRKPLVAAGVSEAALFRSLAGGVTLLFDEVDAVFGPKAREHEDVRAMLNAGYQRGTPVLRCVGEGSKQRVESFDVYGPKLLCGIGVLPTTIADRSLPIRLKRRRRDEPVKRWRKRDGVYEQAGRLHARLTKWAEAAGAALAAATPQLPDELDDRAQDAYEPLLAIAEAAGDAWAARARRALVELRAEQDHDDEGAAVRLLADIQATFAAASRDRLSTAELLDRLAADEEAPWRNWHKGDRRLSPRTLGRLLGSFEIRSRTIRLDDGTTAKGYHADQFEDAWKRYPPGSADSIRHTVTTRSPSQEAPVSHPSQTPVVTDSREGANPHEQTDVTDVTDRNQEAGRFSAECIVCDRPFDHPADPDAGPVTCPACVAARRRANERRDVGDEGGT